MKPIIYLLFILLLMTGCVNYEAEQATMQPFLRGGDRIQVNIVPKKPYDYGDVIVCQFEDRENI